MDAGSLSASPDPERGWGYCARIPGPCNSAPLLATFAAVGWLGVLLHPARLDRRAAFQAFQPRNLVTLCGDQRLQLRDLAEQLYQQRLQIGAR